MKKILFLVPLAVVLVLIGAASFGVTSHVGAALITVAHAQGSDAQPAVQAVDAEHGMAFYLALGLAVIGGVMRILDVAIPGLKFLAPRTKSTMDDSALAFAQSAHDRLDALEQLVVKIGVATPRVDPAGDTRIKQGGFVRAGVLALLMLVGVGIGCAAFKTDVKAVADGVVTCAKADKAKVEAASLQLGTEVLASVVLGQSPNWDTIKADALAAGKTQGLEVAACAFGGLVSDLAKILSSAGASVAPGAAAHSFAAVSADEDVTGGGIAALMAFEHEVAIVRIDL